MQEEWKWTDLGLMMLLSVRRKIACITDQPSTSQPFLSVLPVRLSAFFWYLFQGHWRQKQCFERLCCELRAQCKGLNSICFIFVQFQTEVGFLYPSSGMRFVTIDSGSSAAPVIKKFYVEDGKHCSKPTVAGLFILNEISVEQLSNQPKESIVSLSFSLKCF